MAWELNNDKPIYVQLMDYIRLSIISGRYGAGDKLPSVRELAHTASVNPNTMQKALSELENTGLIFSNRTSGRFVTDNSALINQCRKDLATQYCNDFFEKLKSLGLTQSEINSLIEDCRQELH
ncbi:MAG: GntR family transcriptional regulator [Lachnospiraceae bacterium]|nr:GntR family transcriptional regulator [Lachnospiraceae bacterium]